MTIGEFDLDAGVLCLNFTNTLDWRFTDHAKERLNNYSDLIRWGGTAGSLPEGSAERLLQLAGQQPEKAIATYKAAIKLRETIYRLFADISAQKEEVNRPDIDFLNHSLSNSLVHLQISPSPYGFAWDWSESPESLDRVLWPVTRSAGDLLVSDSLHRIGQCADDRGCRYLFLDTSRNGSRRWCSMEACGNRAKARRHYNRHQS
jgi:predicted RNA-binding Zn ribbon-like protein